MKFFEFASKPEQPGLSSSIRLEVMSIRIQLLQLGFNAFFFQDGSTNIHQSAAAQNEDGPLDHFPFKQESFYVCRKSSERPIELQKFCLEYPPQWAGAVEKLEQLKVVLKS